MTRDVRTSDSSSVQKSLSGVGEGGEVGFEPVICTGASSINHWTRCCHTWPRLPPPLLPMPPWEIAHARWNCKACDYTKCSHLQPIAAAGFELTGMRSTNFSKHFMKKVLLPRSTTRSAPFSLEPGLSPYPIQSRVRHGRLVGPRLHPTQAWPSK